VIVRNTVTENASFLVGDYRQPQAVLEVQYRVRVYLEGVIAVLSSSIKRAIKGADPEAIDCMCEEMSRVKDCVNGISSENDSLRR
jgi:hypothetical protein